jgi:hypothetical protein
MVNIPEKVYEIYHNESKQVPWWAKVLVIGGIGVAGIYAIYSVANNFFNPKAPPPPGIDDLVKEKGELVKTFIQSYNSYTQNGTKALTQDQINSLMTVKSMADSVNETILKEYQAQLQAQEALTNGLYNAIVEAVAIVVGGTGSYYLIKYALQEWFKRKKQPPQGGTPVSPYDVLNQAIAQAYSRTSAKYTTQTASALTAVEFTIAVEALSYAYQYLGYTSNAINILNDYLPIANQEYNYLQSYMTMLSDDYANNIITDTQFVNQIVAYDTLMAAIVNMLIYYSVEGFTFTISTIGSWINNAISAVLANQIIVEVAAITIIAGFIIYGLIASGAGSAIIEFLAAAAVAA